MCSSAAIAALGQVASELLGISSSSFTEHTLFPAHSCLLSSSSVALRVFTTMT